MASTIASVSSGTALRRWWLRPALAALAAFVVLFAICLVLVAAIYSAATTGEESSNGELGGNWWRLALWLLFGCQRVAITAQSTGVDAGFISATFAPLSVLLLFGLAIGACAKFAVGNERTLPHRLFAVARFVVLFALLSFVMSFLGDINTTEVHAGVSHVRALFWPLLWALVFGSLGVARWVYGRGWSAKAAAALERRARGSGAGLSGAIAGVLTGLGLALLAVMIFAIAVAASVAPGTDAGSVWAGVIGIAAILPNLVSWVLLGGMGATFQVTGGLLGLSASTSVGIFGSTGVGASEIDVPKLALLLLLIPITAVLRAGFVAARQSRDQKLAVRAALFAATPLALGGWLLAWISSGRYAASGAGIDVGSLSWTISPVAALLLPPVWAFVGTWLGALLWLAQQRRLPAPAANVGDKTTEELQPAHSDEPIICPRCGKVNVEGNDYCERCGEQLISTG